MVLEKSRPPDSGLINQREDRFPDLSRQPAPTIRDAQGAMANPPKRRLSDLNLEEEADCEISPELAEALAAPGTSSELAAGELNPELQAALAGIGELTDLITAQVPLNTMAFAGIDDVVVRELASFSAAVQLDAEGIAGIDGAIAAAEAGQAAVAQMPSGIDFDAIAARMEELKAHFRTIDAAIEDELDQLPFTTLHKDPFDLIRDFSVHPKGLGLPEEEFLEVFERGDWLKFYHAWKAERSGGPHPTKQKAKAGRPPKGATSDIRRAWIELGQPVMTSPVLSSIARVVFPTEWEKATTESERRKLRERIRAAIKRHEDHPAT